MRICENLREILCNRITKENQQRIILQCKYGFGGSSSHSQYKRKFVDENDENGLETQDSSMILMALVPLRLIITDSITNKEKVIWQNPIPSSPSYCRPLRLQFLKESPEVIVAEKARLNEEITNLKDLQMDIASNSLKIEYQVFPSMFDIKSINALTSNDATQTFYICNLGNKHFKNIDYCLSAPVNEETLQYGISSLHARLRFFECVYKIGYKLPWKTWRLGKKNKNYSAFKERKNMIIKAFKTKLNLTIDQPKQTAGNTTDGNSARKVFQHPEILSEITGVDLDLIKRFADILEAITCSYAIDPNLFADYCIDTARKYVALYKWYKMPPTVHKVLIHGKAIIIKAPVPIRMLSEEAQEACNKLIRRFREFSARKMTREKTMEDVFQRLMANSDPLIASLRNKSERKRLNISSTVRTMLVEPNVIDPIENTSNEIEEAVEETEIDTEEENELETTVNLPSSEDEETDTDLDEAEVDSDSDGNNDSQN